VAVNGRADIVVTGALTCWHATPSGISPLLRLVPLCNAGHDDPGAAGRRVPAVNRYGWAPRLRHSVIATRAAKRWKSPVLNVSSRMLAMRDHRGD